jgi:hypothetical protein
MMKALAAVFAFYGCSLFLGIDSPPHVTILWLTSYCIYVCKAVLYRDRKL